MTSDLIQYFPKQLTRLNPQSLTNYAILESVLEHPQIKKDNHKSTMMILWPTICSCLNIIMQGFQKTPVQCINFERFFIALALNKLEGCPILTRQKVSEEGPYTLDKDERGDFSDHNLVNPHFRML